MTISPRIRALLAGLAAIVAVAAIYVIAIKPQHRRASQLNASIAAAQRKLTAAESAYTNGRAAQQRVKAIELDYVAAQKAVPGTTNIPALLRLLARIADAAHVSLETIAPASSSSASSSSSTTSSSSGTATGATATGTAASVPVALTFTGGYAALNRMVRALDGLVAVAHGHLQAHGPLVGITSVSLSPDSSATSGAGAASSLSVQLSTVIYQRSAAASAGSTTTTGGTS